MVTDDVVKGSKKVGSFMTVRYHNKGIEMLELPKILHSKCYEYNTTISEQ